MAGSSLSTRVATASGKLFICGRHERRASTPLHDRANLRAERGNLVSRYARADVLEQQNPWIERQRASKPQADAFGGIELRNRPRPGSLRNPHLRGQASRAYPHVLWRRLDVERKRHRQVLHHGQRVQQHRPVADDAKAIDEGQPVRAGVDGRRGPAEHPHLAPIRQRRAGDEVDQHLRGHLVQPQDGELFARVQRERLNTKRPQAAIVLGNSRQLDDGRWRHAHAPSRPLTSSTIRDDSVSAANSTLIAARLQAIAP